MALNVIFDRSASLRLWYRAHARELPWRATRNPYHIWLSEIILQQTRVLQGLPYYLKFISLFPDIQSFASAGEDAILKAWQGLGYYSRARNMIKTAQTIVHDFEGKFPDNFDDLKKLPGIGDYTAAAIASFAFDQPVAAVDGNIRRVLSRLFAANLSSKELQILAGQLLDPQHAAEHNQAMMELGATLCVPSKPDCQKCPWFDHCMSGKSGKWTIYPEKNKKVKQKIRYFNYWVPVFRGNTLFRQRQKGDIWEGLFEFPLFESNVPISNINQFKYLLKEVHPNSDGKYLQTARFKHILTHQIIHAQFHILEYNDIPFTNSGYQIVAIDEINIKFACSRLTELFLNSREFMTYVSQ